MGGTCCANDRENQVVFTQNNATMQDPERSNPTTLKRPKLISKRTNIETPNAKSVRESTTAASGKFERSRAKKPGLSLVLSRPADDPKPPSDLAGQKRLIHNVVAFSTHESKMRGRKPSDHPSRGIEFDKGIPKSSVTSMATGKFANQSDQPIELVRLEGPPSVLHIPPEKDSGESPETKANPERRPQSDSQQPILSPTRVRVETLSFGLENKGPLSERYEVMGAIDRSAFYEVNKIKEKATGVLLALKTLSKNKWQMTDNFADELKMLKRLVPSIALKLRRNTRALRDCVSSSRTSRAITSSPSIVHLAIRLGSARAETCSKGCLDSASSPSARPPRYSVRSSLLLTIVTDRAWHTGTTGGGKNRYRDLKPENVLFEREDTDSAVRLVGFGRGRILRRDASFVGSVSNVVIDLRIVAFPGAGGCGRKGLQRDRLRSVELRRHTVHAALRVSALLRNGTRGPDEADS